MDRSSKLFIVGSTAVMIAVQIWLLNGSWPGFWLIAAALMVALAVASACDRRAVSLVLAAGYVFPLAIRILHGRYHIYYSLLWSGALFAVVLPRAALSPWEVPRRWRAPLAAWAIVVIAAAAVTIARESDFYAGLWFHEQVSGPLFAANWILHVALILVIGILWFDWLCGQRDLDLVRWVAAPLGVSCAILAAVAIYQGLVDIDFYNETVYGVMGRATGTVFDGNVCALIAAFWVAGAALLGERAGRFRWATTLGGMAIAWMAVWATASRTGFAAALVATGCVAVSAWRSRDAQSRPTWRTAIVALAAAAVLIAAFAFLRSSETGPLQRLGTMLPDWSPASFVAMAKELWNRNRYGELATLLIQRFPWFGIGLGSFPTLSSELAMRQWNLILEPDNAQNWFRQQLVELGVVGSVPWIVWTVMFTLAVLRRSRGEPPVRSALRGVIVAFALVSLVGNPGQDVSVALTFWTFAGLYVAMDRSERPPAAPLPRFTAAAVTLLVAIFIVGTWQTGMTTLRPSIRARDNRQPYSYGFNALETDGRGGVQQWARRRAVTVIEPTRPVMRLSISVNHQDLAERPVHAKVSVDGLVVFNDTISNSQPIVRSVTVPANGTRIVLRSEVDRVVRPSDFGSGDPRELGLLLGWTFVDLAR